MNLDQRFDVTTFEDQNKRNEKMTKRSDKGFNDLGIAPKLIKEIDRLNFKTTTPVQKEAIPAGIKGDDLIAIAQTGSGKTIAYGVPMLQRLGKNKNGIGLVLVPTRELAIQVDESIKSISGSYRIRSTVIIGGAAISTQITALKRNSRIIIATPGRLMDHIERRTVDLSKVEIFVLDEADRMLDMGFIPDIKKIMKSLPDEHQTMLFSATMPDEIEAIAKKLMDNPTRIEIDRSGVTPSEISHEMFYIKNHDKKRLLALQLKQYTGPVLIFTRTKRMASQLSEKLRYMGFGAAEIHSNRSLEQRRRALEGFKRGRYQILVATDIAARGIDVTGIELVVNYDMPANSEDYVHRIGRTGRAGKRGHAISYVAADQKRAITNLEKFMDLKLEISEIPNLPSESTLMNEASHLNLTNDLWLDEAKPNREFSQKRSPKKRVFKKKEPKKFVPRRHQTKKTESNHKDTNQADSKRDEVNQAKSNRTSSNRTSSSRTSSLRTGSKPQDSKWKESKSKVSKSLNDRLAEFNQSVANSEDPIRPDFEKKWPKKKTSVGQGGRRKKRSKRK